MHWGWNYPSVIRLISLSIHLWKPSPPTDSSPDCSGIDHVRMRASCSARGWLYTCTFQGHVTMRVHQQRACWDRVTWQVANMQKGNYEALTHNTWYPARYLLDFNKCCENLCVVDIGLCTKWHPTTYLLTNNSCHVHITYGDISVKVGKAIGIHFTGHALCALNSRGFGVTVECLTFRCCRHWKTPGTLIDMRATACACKTRVTIDCAPMHEDLSACMILWAAPSNDIKNGGKNP